MGAAGGAPCGDLVKVSLIVAGDRVVEAAFDASGCSAASAAASATVELVDGAHVLDCARVTPGDVASALGGLSLRGRHAAVLAADALHRALGAAARAGAIRLAPSGDRTLVAMSGGVDSTVAARLALDAGHEVIGVTLELWADPETDGTASCCSPQAVAGARALAHRLGLPHLTLDLRDSFRVQVVEDFVTEHSDGRTPNPCVRCNGHVRFDAMLALAGQLGAGRLATGHYARVARDATGPLLRQAADPAKDQTYMLARLRPEALERLWFPLGDLDKPAVRERARAAGLSVADKPESQDLCFLAGTARDRFLRRHGAGRPRPRRGEIVDRAGTVVGAHGGQEHFTVGQRRGIGVAASEPLYVLAKDAAANRVTVGPRSALATASVALAEGRLERPSALVDRVKLRYRSEPVPSRVDEDLGAGAHERLTVALERPVDAPAPGQTACLLAGDAIVGWGTVA